MLNVREIEAMDKRRKNLMNEKDTHMKNNECTEQHCPKCVSIQSQLKEMESIASDAWSPF